MVAVVSGCNGRVRLTQKQPRPATYETSESANMDYVVGGMRAMFDTGELAALDSTVKRRCIHYTHVRTFSTSDIQPDQMTREDLWEHLLRVYSEAYPLSGSPTGSIVLFGLIVQERHAAGPDADRALHRHAAIVCNSQHYWNKVASLSRKHGVVLNAVAHDNYVTMYRYLRESSQHKPIEEIDANPFFSPFHPRGDALASFLQSCAHSSVANIARHRGTNDASRPRKRERCPNIFETIRDNKLLDVESFRVFALQEASEGRTSLAEYCTRQGSKLRDIIQNAADVLNVNSRLARSRMSLVEKLAHAAEHEVCICGGVWANGAMGILERNNIPVSVFKEAVMDALRFGAKRHRNILCIGAAGCGKSSLIEPLQQIFLCHAKPQAGSTFSLLSAMEFEVLLWQDYEHHEQTLSFSDLLCFLVGETVGVREPGRKCVNFRNVAPAFVSAPGPIELRLPDKAKMVSKNRMMAERFRTFEFNVPLPLEIRDSQWVSCGKCAARFFMSSGEQHAGGLQDTPVAETVVVPQERSAAKFVAELSQLAHLFHEGLLTEDEFACAKRRVLHLS